MLLYTNSIFTLVTPNKRVLNFYSILGMLCLWLIQPTHVSAQTRDSVVSRNITQLTSLWLLNNAYAVSMQPEANFDQIETLYNQPTSTQATTNFSQSVLQIQRQQYSVDKGVSVNGNYIENFGVGPTGEDDLIYRRRVQAGVEWDLLDGGLLDNKKKIAQLDNQMQIAALKQQQSASSSGRLNSYNTLIYAFNLHKIELLQQRKALAKQKLQHIYELYAQQAIPYTDVLTAQQQQADIDALLRLYAGYNEQLKPILNDSLFPKDLLPLFDIDSRQLFAASGSNISGDSINKLVLENLALDNKWINDVKLSVAVRYNYYDPTIITADSRTFLSAGVNFTMPIYFGRNETERLLNAQRQELQQQQTDNTNTRTLHLANLLYAFRYKLKQYESFQEKRRQYVELIRIERVKQQFGDLEFNPITALNLLDQLMQIDIELMDIRQQLYLSLLDIQLDVPNVPVQNYVIPYTPQAMVQPYRAYDRSIYIWSKSVDNHSASTITTYLRANSFSTAIVSVGGSKETHVKTTVLLDSLRNAGIRIELMLGENKLLRKKDPVAYIDSLLQQFGTAPIAALHLDVEPHTFEDWDKNKKQYLDEYLVMVQKIRTYCLEKKMQLCVSIPVFYPEDFLNKLYPLVDRVYVMAYEQVNADKMAEKTREERAISAERTIIAIRAKDFDNRPRLDDFMILISKKMQLTGIAIHDFETLLLLDSQPDDH